jgi:hypothetical protein
VSGPAVARKLTRRGQDIFDRSIDVQILRLRRKLEADPSAPQIIQTERGVGYVFARALALQRRAVFEHVIAGISTRLIDTQGYQIDAHIGTCLPSRRYRRQERRRRGAQSRGALISPTASAGREMWRLRATALFRHCGKRLRS